MVLLQVMAAGATVSLGAGMTAQADTLPQLTFAKSTASDNILTNQHFDVELQVSNTASKTNTIDLPNDVNLDGPEEFKQIKKVFKDSHYTSGDNGAFTVTAKQLTVAYNPDKRRITVQWSDEYPQVKVPIRLTAVKAEKLALVAVADDQKGPALNVEIKQPQTQTDQASTSSASSSAATDTNSSTASSSRQATSSAASSDSSRSAATTLSSQAVNQTSASSSEPSQETAANQSSAVTESAGETTDSSTSISSSSTASQVFSSSSTKQATASVESSPLIPVTRLAQLSSNVVDVSQWSQLVDAWKDASVDEINITADISNPTAASGALDSRLSGNIIVNGNGHSVNIGRAGFHTRRNTATSDTMYTATFMNFASLIGSFSNDAGLIGSSTGGDGPGGALNWTFNVSNITVQSGTSYTNTSRRFVSAQGNQVNITGNCRVTTVRENILCGGFDVAAGQTFTGSKIANGDDNSFIWFIYDNEGTGNRQANIEEGATLNCIRRPTSSTSPAYTSYPVIFDAYESINVGKNATFNASVPGNAYSNHYIYGSTKYHRNLYADTGSTVNLTSLARGQSPIGFTDNATSTFQSSSGANIYVIAATGAPLISGGYARLATVRFINPNNLDLRNSSTGTSASASSINQDNVGTFEIQDSNISLWKLASSVTGGADYSYSNVSQLLQQGSAVTATDSNLQSNYLSSKMRRISATNQKPQLAFNNPYDGTTKLTDADQKLRTRVIVAMVPDTNGVQDDGTVNYIPQYASAGQLTVSYSVNGKTITAQTDSNGYATANVGAFLKAGTTITASTSNTSGTTVTATGTVVDVTPPNPATKVVPDPIRVSSGTVSGQNGEPGAQVTLALNGQIQTNVKTVVNANGTWSLDLTGLSLKIGDKIIIYMADSLGNRNPDPNSYPNGQQYHDATFQPAPIFTVAKDLIVNPIDPDDPSKPGTGGTNNLGPLSLDAVPTYLNFGQHSIPTMDTAYPLLAPSAAEDQLATATDGQKYATVGGQKNGQDSVYTQVTDTRDTPSGWQLTAQLSALTANDGTTMTGSYVTLTSGIAQYLNASTNKWVTSADQNQATLPAMIKLTPGATQQTLIAGTTGQQGVGTNQQIWNVNNVALHVQGGRVMAKNYSGTITWQLNSLPSQ
ncbi:WxL domain-containing protein [Lactiplantibacillus paraplantarum]|uniref:WxL domain-containing protein n=1 Tax=Lactiplantibacillus paraplantarum TaxID=60520 RepID=UPI0023AADBDB|nr:WxL domain-containing protein [Lactiplantibacillus paraplantarum]WEE35813.1 WxL domain-containing protein [Lactiplantibacillus paraplantarum]